MTIKSEKISFLKKVLLHLYFSLLIAIILFLFLWAFDPKNWKVIDASIWINLIVILFFGILLSILFFYTEFRNFSFSKIILDNKEITVYDKKNNVSKIYLKKMIVGIKVHKSFYNIIGYHRINILFQPATGKKLQFESFLIKKEDETKFIDKYENYTKQKNKDDAN